MRRQQGHPRTEIHSSACTISDKRDLSSEERSLIEWLIANGSPEAKKYSDQLTKLHLVSRSCGCPPIDLAVGDAQMSTTGPSEISADLLGLTPEGISLGVILHARQGKISELEVYFFGERATVITPHRDVKGVEETG